MIQSVVVVNQNYTHELKASREHETKQSYILLREQCPNKRDKQQKQRKQTQQHTGKTVKTTQAPTKIQQHRDYKANKQIKTAVAPKTATKDCSIAPPPNTKRSLGIKQAVDTSEQHRTPAAIGKTETPQQEWPFNFCKQTSWVLTRLREQ